MLDKKKKEEEESWEEVREIEKKAVVFCGFTMRFPLQTFSNVKWYYWRSVIVDMPMCYIIICENCLSHPFNSVAWKEIISWYQEFPPIHCDSKLWNIFFKAVVELSIYLHPLTRKWSTKAGDCFKYYETRTNINRVLHLIPLFFYFIRYPLCELPAVWNTPLWTSPPQTAWVVAAAVVGRSHVTLNQRPLTVIGHHDLPEQKWLSY